MLADPSVAFLQMSSDEEGKYTLKRKNIDIKARAALSL